MEIENLKKSYVYLNKAGRLLSKEFQNDLKTYGTWEYHQLALIYGELKLLINTIQDPIKLEKSNEIYRKIKEGKL